MSLSMSQARGTGPSMGYTKIPRQAKENLKRSSPMMKCRPGFVLQNGRCMAQTEFNKKNNVNNAKMGTTVDKANSRFYK